MNCFNGLKTEQNEKTIWKYKSKSIKSNSIFYVTNLGLIYKTKSDGIIISVRWTDIKSITQINFDHILVVWDDNNGSRWRYQIKIKKNAQNAIKYVTLANLNWSKINL